ncbi:hypothetical protein AB1Y20_016544 [Prymnesium parvum]|uniref:PH domain-containing protein n=1 Tax=Prymnesium parvum TaxID=97485 RepID=A0AB34IDU8_PRYPA
MLTAKEGWLRKNHKSGTWAAANARRWFVSDGFHVFYYEDNTKSSVRGHFDLRNVTSIRPSADAAAPSAIDLEVAQQSTERRAKRLIISFVTAPDDMASWLRLWCSAVHPRYVDEKLKPSADPALHAHFNTAHAEQPAPSAKLNRFSRKWSQTRVLTPRASSKDLTDQLDTPRETPRAAPPPSAAPPPPAAAPPPPSAAAADEDVTFEVTVPEGVKPGDKLQATTPAGVKVKLVVPENAEPGMSLTFTLPKGGEKPPPPPTDQAAIAIQSRMRGMKARKKEEGGGAGAAGGAPQGPPPTPDEQKAAIALQSQFRGHVVRNEQQEQSRLQWMEYYKQPHVADFEKARELAVSPEEEDAIEAAKMIWADEEARRVKWFKHYLDRGNLKEAAKLVVTPLEEARLIMAQVRASNGLCACFVGESKQALEARREEKFKDAIKLYEWDIAETLALSAEEIQDVEDSKLRVDLMNAAKVKGEFDKALAYTITLAEREAIEASRAEVEATLQSATAEQAAAAAKMQARVRGQKVRGEKEKEKMEKASIVVQKQFRAHADREQEEERRRITWMHWHLQQKEFDKALELAITKDERQVITDAKAKAQFPDLCKCFNLKPRPVGRKEKFIAAIRNYDWDTAQLLAVSDEEREDLEDSKNRVAWMLHYTADGKKEEALALAITDEEKAEIESKG